MPAARTLVHSAWFDFACARLGGAAAVDDMLGRELFRLSLYADLVPVVIGAKGVERIVEVDLNGAEKTAFEK